MGHTLVLLKLSTF